MHYLDRMPEYIVDPRSPTVEGGVEEEFEDEEGVEEEDIIENCSLYIANEFDISPRISQRVVTELLRRLEGTNIPNEEKCFRIVRFIKQNPEVIEIVYGLDGSTRDVPQLVNLLRNLGRILHQRQI